MKIWRRWKSEVAPRPSTRSTEMNGRVDDPDFDEVFTQPTVQDDGPATNLAWNRERWGQKSGWTEHDQFGYRWGGGTQQSVGEIANIADKYFRPFTDGRYDLRIMELAPGGGRFTVELLRYAAEMALVDMNEAAIELCCERFKYLPTPISYVVNDGRSFAGAPGGPWDAVVSYDSMVHMHPTVIEGYLRDLRQILSPSGFAWLDHSGRGQRESGHRTDMSAQKMVHLADNAGLRMIAQLFRNDWDCISVLRAG